MTPEFVESVLGRCFEPAVATPRFAGVSTDSRTARAGELFVPLAGPRFDGHDYLAMAAEKGCAATLASRSLEQAPLLPRLAVADTLVALHRLALAWRRQVSPYVVGITGSSGKTTAKEMVAAILSRRYRVHATTGNLNNHVGVPLTLLSCPRDREALVVEMGMNHAGEIAVLARIARPRVGVVTTVLPAHLAAFADIAAIARAKGELVDALPGDGAAVLPMDNDYYPMLEEMAHCRVISFGFDPEALVRGEGFTPLPGGSSLRIHLPDGVAFTARLPLPGRHMAQNALAAAAVGWLLGVGAEEMALALSQARTAWGRGQWRQGKGGVTLIDDCYNANPGSMRAALETLGEATVPGRRVALLGDMRELGPRSPELHAALADTVRQHHIDLLLTCGEGMGHLHDACADIPGLLRHHRESTAAWLGATAPLLENGDVVLIKGSRGMGMEKLVAELLD